jgi:hypothetical protein
MNPATDRPNRSPLQFLLAGLQAGMMGALVYLFWMGVSGILLRRGFWDVENLMASALERSPGYGPGFSPATLSGLAAYLLVYSSLGAAFAFVVRDRLTGRRLGLVSVAFALAWYYATFHGLWEVAAPSVAEFHVERSTVLGHALYGAALWRYQEYMIKRPTDPETRTEPEPAPIPAGRDEDR